MRYYLTYTLNKLTKEGKIKWIKSQYPKAFWDMVDEAYYTVFNNIHFEIERAYCSTNGICGTYYNLFCNDGVVGDCVDELEELFNTIRKSNPIDSKFDISSMIKSVEKQYGEDFYDELES
jgi:hypothetical protein